MTATTRNGTALHGYLPAARPRYQWFTCEWTDWHDPEEPAPDGAEPFRAELRTNLTWGEIDQIDLFSGNLVYADLWKIIAPHVRDWNLLGQDLESGEVVKVPPPAEAGPDAFKVLDAGLTFWIAVQLRTAHLGGEERGKGSGRPARAPASTPDDAETETV